MANRRQVPFLHWRRKADGLEHAEWKPSPRLRKLGWTKRDLGFTREHEHKATLAALAINQQLAEWEAARAAGALAAPAPAPKVWTVADLIAAYKAHTDWTDDLKPSTRREYTTRLNFIDAWARDAAGRSIAVKSIDADMVRDLKTALLAPDADGKPGSRFRCAGTLRVLRLLLNRPEALKLTGDVNPTRKVKIPGTDSRQQKLTLAQAETLAAAADAAGLPIAARAIRVAFWSLQRESDLLALSRFKWRQLENVDPRDRPALSNPKGEVWGFRLRQLKTGVWIDAPMPPALHAEIAAAFEASECLLPARRDPDRPMPAHRLQRQLRPLLDAAGFPDRQIRDLRRSGMSFFKDHGALQSNIFAISGHAVLGKKTIADTYMPPDTQAACAAIAAVLRTLARIAEREKAEDLSPNG